MLAQIDWRRISMISKKARDSEFNVNMGLIVFVFLIEVIETLNQIYVIISIHNHIEPLCR